MRWLLVVVLAACSGGEGDERDGGGAGTDASGDDAGPDSGRAVDGGPSAADLTPPEFRFCEGPTGRVIEAGPADYAAAVRALVAGDTLRLAPGTYAGGLDVHGLNGAEDECIVIEGPAGSVARFTGSSSRNTISIRDSSYVVIRNLEVDGTGALGDGLKCEGDAMFAHHLVVENLHIHDLGGDMQIVGINTKCPAWRWVIRHNLIVNSGTGLYLGGSGGDLPFIGGLIEHNAVLDPLGYGMQIKHQIARPDLPGIPATATTIIRHNVFSKTNRAATGADARPNLLVGHFPESGPGADDQYLIYGNFLHDNPTGEALFQGEGNVAFYDNVLVSTTGSGAGVTIQPHNDVPKRIHVLFNTVLVNGTGVRVTGGDPAFAQIVAGNAVFAGTPLGGGTQRDNVTGAPGDAATYLAMPSASLGMLDLHPRPGQLAGPVDLAGVPSALAIDRDFDGRLRTTMVRGAYLGPAEATSWVLARERMP